MKKGMIKLSVATVAVLMGTSLMAGGSIAPVEPVVEAPVKADKPKRQLRGNMTLKYNVLPGSADTIAEMFSEGMFYGRLRTNTFYWQWADTSNGLSNVSNKNMGVGGSLIYKSAAYKNFSFTLGYYGSLNPEFWRPDAADAKFSKAGKDTFSRYKVKNGDGYGMHTLGQGFLEYNNGTVDIKAGRQLFESVFTKSNDTKMIPNTFDGVSAAIKVAPKSKFRLAWFGAQKLRDHENSHDVVTFKNASGESWGNNDDAGKHRGLNYNNFVAAGENPDHDMYLADFNTKDIKNLNLTLSYLQIPGVVKDIVAEAHYKIPVSDSGWAVRPGIRYFYQMDDGGGAVAGDTNVAGKAATANGYDAGVANSLDTSLFNARLDLLMPNKKGFFRLGYSKVADEADILAPWRGFPTGGFTRAMAQYNWVANTETFMVRAVYKFNSTWKASIRYAVQDYDDNKDYVLADSTVIHIDTWTNFTKNLQMRMRYGHVVADDSTLKVHAGGLKRDYSYDEFRVEFNYLF